MLAVFGFVVQADGVGFDRDATLAFEVHRVEDLLHHFALRERPVNSSRRSASVDLP